MITKIIALVASSYFDGNILRVGGNKGSEVRSITLELLTKKPDILGSGGVIKEYLDTLDIMKEIFENTKDLADRPFVIAYTYVYHLRKFVGFREALPQIVNNVTKCWGTFTYTSDFRILNRNDTPETSNIMLSIIGDAFMGEKGKGPEIYSHFNLVEKDKLRAFSDMDKETIRASQGGKCSYCGEDVPLYNTTNDGQGPHYHHIVRHTDGGRTYASNGILVHGACHKLIHQNQAKIA